MIALIGWTPFDFLVGGNAQIPWKMVRVTSGMLKWVLPPLIARPHSRCEVPDLPGILGGTSHRPGSYPHRSSVADVGARQYGTIREDFCF
ncbi:hypothetical protein [Mesorhizobium sp.]|uniref:hypothetical protein n=1 Tax=Mesorhizobium sp. TaxID=1871066 RepID=UPI000FD33A05|nr:hypothetical protein [Mesorhizobium sp.]RVC59828.1 hypothetical protein EN779_15065 [Mesorhizobium sp. M4B.F.Ca.ET.088.02.2.1]RWF25840.1 MAG: hypothetical protein EOS45_29800 [Mesorhizobium sp.]TIX43425.1 MAG: hypothetical protein E5V40_03270 [Mesorhizobium sp.]